MFVSLYGESIGMENVGLFFTFCAAALLVTCPLIGKLIDRGSYNVMVLPGFVLFTAGMVILSLWPVLTGFLITAMLVGIAFGALCTSLHNVPDHRFGARPSSRE